MARRYNIMFCVYYAQQSGQKPNEWTDRTRGWVDKDNYDPAMYIRVSKGSNLADWEERAWQCMP
jgi:hypothetical protein